MSKAALNNSHPPFGNSFGRKSELTDMALLEHQLGLKRKQPPRKILPRARSALLELFPCWMMVPSEVAKLLPRSVEFDLVIIDEASQMTPEVSISALMRAEKALIAGDTNQLPPTNFFKNVSSDDDADEDIETPEESILELANIQFHPKHRLLWHYRSKHEALIAFSNHYVYDNELVIFPSAGAHDDTMGVSLVQVNGKFQEGINPAEAAAMADAIEEFMETNSHRSLGVAVMNQSQMEFIEGEMERRKGDNQKVSAYYEKWEQEREGLEHFFVKNLETIQGDERDVIFVGTVYGKDADGRFYQRFGPINGPSGKRRLNVLFSRAKEQIITFSSIPVGEFKPNPTNEGATLLKRWLEYSATKRLGEKPQNHDRAGSPDSPFEEHVIELLVSWLQAIPQIGVFYFIDIGVKHPSYPFGYITGVECDGATYHSSRSARDRDRLREEVLKRLGWDLYRIWSTDWFRDPLHCREKIKEYLDSRLEDLKASMPEFSEETLQNEEVVREEISILDKDGNGLIDQNEKQKIESSKAEVGSFLTIRYTDVQRGGTTQKITLVSKVSAAKYTDDGYREIETSGPLGKALLGKMMNEEVLFKVGSDNFSCVISEIE